jgi:hypothetical protein
MPFTPWTTVQGFRELLHVLAGEGLVENVAPVQLTLRMLIASGSRLLELEDVRAVLTGFDAAGLVWRWQHPDPGIDELAASVLHIVHEGTKAGSGRGKVFRDIWDRVHSRPMPENPRLLPRTVIPYMEEPWFC